MGVVNVVNVANVGNTAQQGETVTIEYDLVRSRRKTVGIYISPGGGIEVRAPRYATRAQVQAFVDAKTDWILRHLDAQKALPQPEPLTYEQGARHYYLGEEHQLQLGRRPVAVADVPVIALNIRAESAELASPDKVAAALNTWYRRQGLRLLTQRHDYWREQLQAWNLPPSEVKLRLMKRRWGSCSRSGTITFNTQLVRYPMHCVDAVVVHELCHLLEFNHSKRFYALMDSAYPQWRDADEQLKQAAHRY